MAWASSSATIWRFPREARSAASRCSTSASCAAGADDLGRVDELPRRLRSEPLAGGAELDQARFGVGALRAGDGEGAADGAKLVLGGRRVGGVGVEQGAALGLGTAVELADAAAEAADLALHPREGLVGDLALPPALPGEVLVDDGIGDRPGGDRVGGGGHDLDDEGVGAAADRERGPQHVGHPRRALLALGLGAEQPRRARRGEADGTERDAEARQVRTGGAEGGGGPDRRPVGVEHPEAPGGALEDRGREQDGDLVRDRRRVGQDRRLHHVGDLAELDLVLLEQDLGAGPVARRQPAAADPDQDRRQEGRGEERPPAPEEGLDEAAQADRPEVAPPVEADLAPRLLAGVDHAAPRRPAHSARASA